MGQATWGESLECNYCNVGVAAITREGQDNALKIFCQIQEQLIVEEESVGVDYVSLTGTKPENTKCKDFATLPPCYFRFVRPVAPQYTAERLRYYMATNLVLNTNKGITIRQGAGRVIKMNKALPCLPCLKHKEGSPMTIPATNAKYVDIKLCTIVLNAVNICVSTAFCASV